MHAFSLDGQRVAITGAGGGIGSACARIASELGAKVCATDLRAPKKPAKLPETIDVDDLARVLDAAPDDTLETRDLALLELFYSAGARLAEVAELDLADIDLAEGEARVIGKGNKERRVPIGVKAAAALDTCKVVE